MPTNILMPALSPTMEQGKLAKWLKKEGDQIKSGDVLAEIETDKATMEVEAVDEGTLAKILIPDGTDNVAVNTPIAVIAGGGIAALTKGTTAVVRAKSAALTGGLGNPVVSTAETAGAAAVSILAIAAPLLCLGGVIIIVVWAVRRLRRIAR